MTVNSKTPKKGKWFLLFLILCLVVASLAALSINRVREGQGDFLANLWATSDRNVQDPILAGNPKALIVPSYVKTILLLGSDYLPDSGFRTDVMLLVAINTRTHAIHMISFPRDLWVTIPGFGEQRLNTAFPYGDFQSLSDTLAYNFGFRPDHYAMVDFEGFKHLLDIMGTIDVQVGLHTEDECPDYLDPSGWCVVEPGKMEMSQRWAFWYVRTRYNSSDFDRNRRAQEVLQAMVKKTLSPVMITRLPAIVRGAVKTVKTDMSWQDGILYALPLSKWINPDISHFYITPNEAAGGVTDEGAMVLYPDIPAIQSILRDTLWVTQ